jgi:type 1 glutamine amidotransferase
LHFLLVFPSARFQNSTPQIHSQKLVFPLVRRRRTGIGTVYPVEVGHTMMSKSMV